MKHVCQACEKVFEENDTNIYFCCAQCASMGMDGHSSDCTLTSKPTASTLTNVCLYCKNNFFKSACCKIGTCEKCLDIEDSLACCSTLHCCMLCFITNGAEHYLNCDILEEIVVDNPEDLSWF